jgi:hypothetical protein
MIRYTPIKYCISYYNITILILSFTLIVNSLNQWLSHVVDIDYIGIC